MCVLPETKNEKTTAAASDFWFLVNTKKKIKVPITFIICNLCFLLFDQIRYLKSKFKIKDLGELKYFLDIENLKTKDSMCMSQRKYCLELFSEFGMLGCEPMDTPLGTNYVLSSVEI